LLIIDDPLQHFNRVLLLPDLLLESIETLQDKPHVDAHLVNLLSMAIHPTSDMVHLLLVVLKGLLLGDNVSPEVSL